MVGVRGPGATDPERAAASAFAGIGGSVVAAGANGAEAAGIEESLAGDGSCGTTAALAEFSDTDWIPDASGGVTGSGS